MRRRAQLGSGPVMPVGARADASSLLRLGITEVVLFFFVFPPLPTPLVMDD